MSTQDQTAAMATAGSSSEDPRQTLGPNIPCEWDRCTEVCSTAEALFDHLCEKHVGRKSTNNLNLTCGWNGCSTTTVKRDHITSHIRVHVPLKPHKCSSCGKAFKRPQDLKKHEKTHADDFMRTSEPHGGNGYRQGAKAATASYYDPGPQMHPGANAYAPAHHPAHNGYYAQQPQQQSYYYSAPSNGMQMTQTETYDRKRQYDGLNDFFGDAKRRQFDPSSYQQVSQSLMSLQGLPTNGRAIAEFVQSAPGMVSVDGHGGPMPIHQYALPLPMPNLRTKTDLINVDQILEQMQATVYESANATAAAGVQQPGAHYTHQAINFAHPSQQMHQMPQYQQGNQAPAPMTASHSAQSSNSATPALTPPSSASYNSPNSTHSMSFNSAHSPVSSHGMSPQPRHNSTTALYPNLPAVSTGYSPHSAIPASTLGPAFDSDARRRYSGGMLQRSAPPSLPGPSMSYEDTSESTTPKAPSVSSPTGSNSTIDSDSDGGAEATWIENIRKIEALRKYVSDRLNREEFEHEQKVREHQSDHQTAQNQNLYPALPGI